MEALLTGDFRADVGLAHDRVVMVLRGSADFEQRPAFVEWIGTVHDEILRHNIRRAELDFRRVDFMSSMCINVLVGWLVGVMDLPLSQQYRVHLRYLGGMFWQRKCTTALERLAMSIVTTEADPAPVSRPRAR